MFWGAASGGKEGRASGIHAGQARGGQIGPVCVGVSPIPAEGTDRPGGKGGGCEQQDGSAELAGVLVVKAVGQLGRRASRVWEPAWADVVYP